MEAKNYLTIIVRDGSLSLQSGRTERTISHLRTQVVVVVVVVVERELETKVSS